MKIPEKLADVNFMHCQAPDGRWEDEAFSNSTVHRLIPADDSRTTISALQPVVSRRQGGTQLHILRQNHQANSIVLEGHHSDGTSLCATLAHTPDSSTLQTSIPTLTSTSNDRTLRIVFNKKAQSSYLIGSVPVLSYQQCSIAEKIPSWLREKLWLTEITALANGLYSWTRRMIRSDVRNGPDLTICSNLEIV